MNRYFAGKESGCAATSGIHKKATRRLSVLNSRRWQTDERAERRLCARNSASESRFKTFVAPLQDRCARRH